MLIADIRLIFGLSAIMVIVMFANMLTLGFVNGSGIVPRTISGLIGIPLSPFLHASWLHLIGNVTTFVPLAIMASMTGKGNFIKASLVIVFLGGLLTWIFGRNAIHVGASGWIFGLWAFVMAYGVFKKDIKSIFLAVVVAIFFGTMIFGVFPRTGVSFESHIFGLIAGMVAAKTLISMGKLIK